MAVLGFAFLIILCVGSVQTTDAIQVTCEQNRIIGICNGNCSLSVVLHQIKMYYTNTTNNCSKYESLGIVSNSYLDLDQDIVEPGIHVSILAVDWSISHAINIDLRGNNGQLPVTPLRPAKATERGADGVDGRPGQNGGSFYGIYKTIHNPQHLTFNVSGGNGANGQSGGNGGKGCIFSCVNREGGNGGNGGAGGEHGLSGHIEIYGAQNNIVVNTTGHFKIIKLNGVSGNHGPGGNGGAGTVIHTKRQCDTNGCSIVNVRAANGRSGNPGGVNGHVPRKSFRVHHLLGHTIVSFRKLIRHDLRAPSEGKWLLDQIDRTHHLSIYHSSPYLLFQDLMIEASPADTDNNEFDNLSRRLSVYAKHHKNISSDNLQLLKSVYSVATTYCIAENRHSAMAAGTLINTPAYFENLTIRAKYLESERTEIIVKEMHKRLDVYIRNSFNTIHKYFPSTGSVSNKLKTLKESLIDGKLKVDHRSPSDKDEVIAFILGNKLFGPVTRLSRMTMVVNILLKHIYITAKSVSTQSAFPLFQASSDLSIRLYTELSQIWSDVRIEVSKTIDAIDELVHDNFHDLRSLSSSLSNIIGQTATLTPTFVLACFHDIEQVLFKLRVKLRGILKDKGEMFSASLKPLQSQLDISEYGVSTMSAELAHKIDFYYTNKTLEVYKFLIGTENPKDMESIFESLQKLKTSDLQNIITNMRQIYVNYPSAHELISFVDTLHIVYENILSIVNILPTYVHISLLRASVISQTNTIGNDPFEKLDEMTKSGMFQMEYSFVVMAWKMQTFPFGNTIIENAGIDKNVSSAWRLKSALDKNREYLDKSMNTLRETQGEILVSANFSSSGRCKGSCMKPFFVWEGKLCEHEIKRLLSNKTVHLVADICRGNSTTMIKSIHLSLNGKDGITTKEYLAVQKSLQNFKIRLIHNGISHFKLGNSVFVTRNMPKTFECKMGGDHQCESDTTTEEIYYSPYTTWTMQLVRTNQNASFEELNRFRADFNLVLWGEGIYVNESGLSEAAMRDLNLRLNNFFETYDYSMCTDKW